MDEGIKSLLWILVWGGLFFLMMRYGCGAHTMGGHGHASHGGHGDSGTAAGGATKDPVCGMTVDPQNAAAASVHGGRTHYFCSVSCRDKFERTPENYTGAPERSGQPHSGHGGHHHG